MNAFSKTAFALAAAATIAASSAAHAGPLNNGQKAFIGGAAGGFLGAFVGTTLSNRQQSQTVVVQGGYAPRNCLVAQQGYDYYGRPVVTYVQVC